MQTTSEHCEILGVAEGAKEDKAGWSGFLKYLKELCLKGVELIISEACIGLFESLGDFYPGARWQRCTVHFYRNIFSFVPKAKMKDVTIMLKAIHASEDLQVAREKDSVSRSKTQKYEIASRLGHIAGTKWSSKRYLNMQLLRKLEVEIQF